jgi:NADH dehydrogenase [ubiquinone] 1 alpha subcomplex assembly factor 7
MKKLITEMIRATGPMPIDRYMALCLGHPTLGYYMNRDPFGVSGDFTTAPEINQIFGELIGIWCVAAWQAVGSPAPFLLVELGPGRGTLMADILRATAKMKEFADAAQVHLVETSPVLRQAQRDKITAQVTWHHSVETLPQEPMIFVANEFFDALPVQQFIKHNGQTYERCVDLEGDELVLAIRQIPQVAGLRDGLNELAHISAAIGESLGIRIKALGGAGLVLDYGHLQSAAGETLQALKAHHMVGVTEYPGESDLTGHVDFEALGQAFAAGGAEVLPFKTQGAFLNEMGLEARAAKLGAKLGGKARKDFLAGASRLVDDKEMGHLFKVMAVAQSLRQPIYPFEAP